MPTHLESPAAIALEPFLAKMREAGIVTGVDKYRFHRYDQVYGRALASFTNVGPFGMLEIGYGAGESLAFWRELFPEAYYYCVDLNHGDWTDGKTFVLRVDQSNPGDLDRVIETVRHPIALIVDDGSHHPSHQLLSFSMLFRQLLQPGGLYIIEDVETSYWRRGSCYGYELNYGLDSRHSTVEAMKRLADFVNRRFIDSADLNWLHAALLDVGVDPAAGALVETVSFSRNAILLTKQLASASDSDLAEYSHLHQTSRQALRSRAPFQNPDQPASI